MPLSLLFNSHTENQKFVLSCLIFLRLFLRINGGGRKKDINEQIENHMSYSYATPRKGIFVEKPKSEEN